LFTPSAFQVSGINSPTARPWAGLLSGELLRSQAQFSLFFGFRTFWGAFTKFHVWIDFAVFDQTPY